MFPRSTVFVLGAGASGSYEFPLGDQLSEIICANVGNNSWVHNIEQCLGQRAIELAQELADQLRKSTMPIDAWLAQNPDFQPVGKYFIAYAIIQMEKEDNLRHGWYDQLWRQLYQPPDIEALSATNRITFITFNYDRSLEQALMIKALNTYRASVEICTQKIGRLRIIHVHGQVGRLPWQRNLGDMTQRPYDAQLDQATILACSKHIKIIGETNGDTPEYVEAKHALNQADRIHFLGFGYNEDNMKRLHVTLPQGCVISGTHLHLAEWKRNRLQQGSNPFGHIIKVDHSHASVQDYVDHMIDGWK